MEFSELNPVPARKCRPLWQRLVALMLCELVIFQPGFAAAQVSQLPNFTVSGLPPNVMLMFDDSGSMARLTLPVPSDLPAFTASRPRGVNPVLHLDTVNYFGIRGVGYAAGSQAPANLPQYDNAWSFLVDEVRERAAAFNPLAYNPMIQYKPWNDNGAFMANAPYGGNGLTAVLPYTPWDMRNLPTAPFAAPGATVRSKIAGAWGRIMPDGAVRTFVGPAGSVDYAGLVSSTNSVAGAEAEGDDLFSSTIWWDNPYCATPGTNDNYAWFCPVGSPWGGPPTEVCDAITDGTFSTTGQCCPMVVDVPGPDVPTSVCMSSRILRRPRFRQECRAIAQQPLGSAPGWSGGFYLAPTIDPPPVQVQCPVGVEGECFDDPPPYPDVCTSIRHDTWRCDYLQPTSTPTCPAPTYRQCHVGSTSATCGGLDVLSPTSPARYKGGYWTPARYAVYEGPASPTPAQRADMSNYRMVMIDRKFAWNAGIPGRDPAHPSYRYRVVDALTGATSYRPDCDAPPLGTGNAGQNGTWCTFEQEAQNYANWYTYYRTRLFSSVAVVSDVLSNFTGAEQRLRMGYGRINYFKDGRNPWNVNSFAPYYTALPNIDGVNNPGAIERGVREFLVSDPIGARADVFKWLFSMSPLGPTPNREALHSVGRYFQRADTFNPYVDNPHPPSASPGEELWCRRNYTVLATDGEWTKLPTGQPRIDDGATDFPGPGDNPVASGVTTSMSTPGAAINGILPNGSPRPPPPFTYDPAVEVQITGGSGSQTATLTDVAHYYWSHDLRPQPAMKNGHQDSPTNRAFWQHLSTYIVGYGVSASMDDDTIRPRFFTPAPRVNIPWPNVGLEDCRQLDNNADDDALPTPNCAFVEPAGNRINDTLRAALAGGGDFFSAASPAELRNNLASVFEQIIAVPSSGTSPSFSNTTLVPGSVFVRSNFRTNVWDGFVEAFDAQAYLDFIGGIGPLPPTEWTDNYAAFGARNIATSTAQNAATDFLWCNLSAAQQSALDPLAAACPTPVPAIIDYLRGDQSKERRFTGGLFRDRRTTILGDIVNSSPVYEKATDDAYHLQPAASFSAASPHGFPQYRTYVTTKNGAAHMPIVMFGANDGMFHVLNATSGSGREIFAYVPRAVYPLLRQYADPAYVHRYSVDGPVVRGDIWEGGVWKTIAIGTTGAGPPGIFAIDITDPTALDFSKVKWDIVPSDHPTTASYLGKTIGAGVIGSVKLDADSNVTTTPNGQWAYIVGNGYESSSDRAALLVFNAIDGPSGAAGTLIRALPVPMSAGPGNGLGAITPVYDGARNIINVYAGDKKGNLWKFDLTSSNPANWKIANEQPAGSPRPLFAAGNNSPILQAPRVTIHPRGGLYVAFGTGKYFEVGDPADNNDQSIFAVWDKGQLPPIAGGDVPLIRIEEYANAGQTFKRLNAADLATYRATTTAQGFQLRLRPDASTGNGERIIAPLILDAGVLVATSFSPEAATDRCIPGGTSFLYRVDLTGGFSRGSFGTEGALTIGRKLNPGTVGSLTPVYTPVDPGAIDIEEMTLADIRTMMADPKYRLSGGTTPVATGPLGACVHAGLDVNSGVARIATNCLGLMPLRAWRPFR